MYSFKVDEEPYRYINKTNDVMYAVANPTECDDFKHLFPQVKINGRICDLVGVVRFAHRGPHRIGETIGLVVKEKDDETPEREATSLG